MSVVRDLVESDELWAGLGAGALAGGVAAVGRDRLPRLVGGFAVAAGVVVAALITGRDVPVAVVLLAAAASCWPLPGRDRSGPGPATPLAAMALSVGAAVGAYACLPDTERPALVLGVVAGVAAVVVLARRPWAPTATATVGALIGLALDDIRRESAIVGTAALAAALAVGVLALRRTGAEPARPALLGAAGLAVMAFCSRVAGLADGATTAGALALVALGAWVAVAWGATR